MNVRPDPRNPLSDGALAWFRTHGVLNALGWTALVACFSAVFVFIETSVWPWALAASLGVFTLVALFSIGIKPTYLVRAWRYEITEHEVYLQHGVFVIRRTVVPLLRIENVDTAQGPIAKRFGVMSVSVSTAAGTHEIPALEADIAESLRDRIARLAREARDV